MKCLNLAQAEKIFAAIKEYAAPISNFKGVGNASTPVYFDEDGVPQSITAGSSKIDCFEIDVNGGIMAIENFTESAQFELDENGDIMPKEVAF